MELTTQDELEIGKILDDYIRLWMDGQAQACADLYDVAGDALGVDGTFLRGRDEIKEYYDNVMSGKYSGLEVRNLRTIGIRSLGQDIALLDGTWELHTPSDDGSSTTVVCSLVVVHTNDVWKISAARLMVPMQLEG
jgi:uncharacterized protein (TIGR02246 family)